MKRKLLSYLLVWLFSVFIWWYFMYVEAAWSNGNSMEDDVIWWNWWWTQWSQWWTQWSQWWTLWNETIDWWTLNEVVVTPEKKCNWIKLNTDFPIIWNCIETKKDASTNPTNAFPMMMWVITQIVVSLILVVCFILIIVAWVKRASDDPKWWKELLQKVAITVILLWLTWVILKAINPVFFS